MAQMSQIPTGFVEWQTFPPFNNQQIVNQKNYAKPVCKRTTQHYLYISRLKLFETLDFPVVNHSMPGSSDESLILRKKDRGEFAACWLAPPHFAGRIVLIHVYRCTPLVFQQIPLTLYTVQQDQQTTKCCLLFKSVIATQYAKMLPFTTRNGLQEFAKFRMSKNLVAIPSGKLSVC